jgi:hypothetical protein
MQMALMGALAGIGLGIVLMLFEYLSIRSAIAERTKRTHRQVQMDATEAKRLHSLFRFCLILPPAFALGAWAIWG